MSIEPRYEYKARLMSRKNGLDPVYDADTIWIRVDLGFSIYWDIGPCRLTGIDAPELRGDERDAGIAARDFLREILNRPENEEFLVRTEKDEQEKYGRYLVTIILADGTNINRLLVESGNADLYS